MLSFSAAQDINLTGYTLTFDDEFNTASITTSSPKGASTWYYLPPYGAAGYYSESQWDINSFTVSGGVLSDTAWLDSSNNWHSGNISSIDATGAGFSQKYGYFEARIQMPNSGDGAWPAFWLTGVNSITNSGQNNEEIDIFEWYGICNTPGSPSDFVSQASHNWNPDGTQNNSVSYIYAPQTPMPDGSYPWQGYHIYGCQIDPVHVTWYIDGIQTNQIATPTSYLTSNFYIMIDYALGGGWPLTGMVNNSSLNIDWVRVYSLPTGGSIPAAPTSLAATGGSAQVSLNWTGSTGATSYNVYRGTTAGGESGTPVATGITSTSYVNTGLSNSTTYYYKVAAVNSYGTSGNSNEATATTAAGANLFTNGTYKLVAQSSGLAMAANGTTNGSAVSQQTYTGASTQQWNLNNLGGNVVTLMVPGTSEALEVPGSSKTDGADLDVSAYANGTNQQWTIVSVGGGYYEVVNVNSGYEANVAYNSTTPGGLICQWDAGNYSNGVWAITAVSGGTTTYSLTVNSGSGSGSYAAGTVVNVTANAAQSGYQFLAWTGNTSALANPAAASTTLTMPASATSITATYTLSATAPAAPTGLTATAGTSQVALSWAASSGATSYSVYRGTSAGGESSTAIATGLTATSYTDSSVSNGTTYYYKVTAVNSVGASGYSNEANATPTAGTGTTSTTITSVQFPQYYANGIVNPMNGNNYMGGVIPVQNWNVADTNTGTSPASNANLVTSTGAALGSSVLISSTGTNTAITFTYSGYTRNDNTQNNAFPAAVWYQSGGLADIYIAGASSFNESGAAETLAVSGLSASHSYNLIVYVTAPWWNNSGSNPASVSAGGTTYYIKTSNTLGTWTQATSMSSGSPTTANFVQFSNLTGSTTQTVTITGIYVGLAGFQIVDLGGGSSAPAAPAGLAATAGTSQVALSWTASTGATSYNVYRGTSAGGESTTAIATGISSTSYTDTGVTNGTTYYYKVTAVNTSGASGYSNEVSASPVAAGSYLIANGTYKLLSQSSGLALATTGVTNGSAVVQQTYTSASTQKWTVTNLGNNVVTLVASGTSEALEVPGSSTTAGTNLDVSAYTAGTNQQWTIVSVGSGYYEVVNVNSGDEANVAGNSMTSGASICQWFAGNYGNGVWSVQTP